MKETEELFKKTFNEPIVKIEKVSATGSNRYYERIISKNHSCIAAYNNDLKENKAFISYAKQLKANNINVPEIYAEDLENNVYLQQDLGDETLFTFLKSHTLQETMPYYIKVMQNLVRIQRIENFDFSYAYPAKAFDKQSMLWDCNYFKYYFLKFFDIQFDERLLEKDFNTFTDYLLSCPQEYFLYRDFIPRNIMLFNNEPYFIDFQGGRKGSCYYDAASFLFDAKTDLDNTTREELLNVFLCESLGSDSTQNSEQKNYFYAYVYMRLIQTMGAYGFRGVYENKKSFIKSIPFALKNLKYLSENVDLEAKIPHLENCFQQIINSQKIIDTVNKNKLTITVKSFSYKKGYPHDVSGNGGGFVFDCRALPNPGRETKFKQMTGLDREVKEYLQQYKEVDYFFANAMNLVQQSIENYLNRGFSNLSVYFGCTGGQHRSVYLAQKCADILAQNPDLNVIIHHIEQNI
ncbi:MAG: phosphotransferase [Bacteroidales bacterium]|nr:phosphotransferase [Bacteroidales bacterium]